MQQSILSSRHLRVKTYDMGKKNWRCLKIRPIRCFFLMSIDQTCNVYTYTKAVVYRCLALALNVLRCWKIMPGAWIQNVILDSHWFLGLKVENCSIISISCALILLGYFPGGFLDIDAIRIYDLPGKNGILWII